MSIRKCFDPVVVTPHPASKSVEDKFILKRDVNGTVTYQKTAEVDINQYVNSFRNGCELSSILTRCALMPNRDKEAYLNQCMSGFEIDCTTVPTDLTDAIIKANELKKSNPDIFNRLNTGESITDIINSLSKVQNDNKNIGGTSDVNEQSGNE